LPQASLKGLGKFKTLKDSHSRLSARPQAIARAKA
jgi:hypothetical protein